MRIAAICLLLPFWGMVQTGKESKETGENAIHAVIKRFVDAWNHHDAKAFAAVFSEDADFTNVRGIGASGRGAIEAFHAPVFATIFSKSHLEYTDIKTRYLRSDIAAVDVRWKMTGAMDPQGNPWPEREGLLNFVMAKNDGRWEIAVMHNLEISALPPSPR